jgi:hypothetical protein
MNSHVNFEFSKRFGENEKGDKKKFYRPFARKLQDDRKVGKIVGDKEHEKAVKKKAVKPPEDKTNKIVSTRSVKKG